MLKISICLILFMIIHVAWADPLVKTQTEYYTVDGETADDIRADMNEKRSGDYDAYTAWQVRWRFFWDNQEDECTINRVTTYVDGKFTLPRLASNTIANRDAKKRWKKYYSALIEHENGHLDFGINAAKEIETALLEMESYASCKALEKAANALAYDILNGYIADEKQYDIDTNHGMNDGAVFP